ncbi:MAG: hypothetical protein JOZ69_16065 [Myxococcales bacterium]|nr:hypothetical protein [Myxococcales bacterium]
MSQSESREMHGAVAVTYAKRLRKVGTNPQTWEIEYVDDTTEEGWVMTTPIANFKEEGNRACGEGDSLPQRQSEKRRSRSRQPTGERAVVEPGSDWRVGRTQSVRVPRANALSGPTSFELPTGIPAAAVPSPTDRFGDVAANIPGLRYGAGFLAYIDDGPLKMLEGYCDDEKWPERVVCFELHYIGPRRESPSRLRS